MIEIKQMSAYEDPSTTFAGIQFLLVGFDAVREEKVRSKLLQGGGVDAVNYGPHCNHVIVENIISDDPICVAARRDGKILVTGLWVDHSFDVGMPVDFNIVMYRPVKDLNGIPGAKNLVMCLTGYQRHDRDDIMNMVALMGAKFSKPLVANKVTHLICYKFEGEKYELAMKIKTMKLVNHLWLEDCLKAWELLPEADYSKSGYELEMEAEAKDSEDETEDMTLPDPKMKSIISPRNTRLEIKNLHQSPERQGVSRNSAYLTAFGSFSNVGNTSKAQLTPTKETEFGKIPFSHETDDGHPLSNSSCARSPAKMSSKVPSNVPVGKAISEKAEHVLASAFGSAKKSVDCGFSKLSDQSVKSSLPLRSERTENNLGSPFSNVSKPGFLGGSTERDQDRNDSHDIRSPIKGSLLLPDERKAVGSPSKKSTVPRGSSQSPVLSHSPNRFIRSGLATKSVDMPVSKYTMDGSCRLACDISPTNGTSCVREEASGGFIIPPEKIQDRNGSGEIKTPSKGALSYHDEEQMSSLSRKNMTVSLSGLESAKKLSRSPKILTGSGLDTKPMEIPVSGSPPVHGLNQLVAADPLTNISSCLREEESGGVLNVTSERDEDGTESCRVKTPSKGTSLHLNKEQSSSLHGPKKLTVPRNNSKSTKLSRSRKTLMGNGLDARAVEGLVSGTSVNGSHQSTVDISPKVLMRSGLDTEPIKMLVPGSPIRDTTQLAVDDPPTNGSSCLREEVGVFDMRPKRDEDGVKSGGVKTPLKGSLLQLNKEQDSSLPGRKKKTVSRSNSKLTKLSRSRKTLMASGLNATATERTGSPSTDITNHFTKEVSPSSEEALPIATLHEDRQECNDQNPKRYRGRPKKRSLPDLDVDDLPPGSTKSCTGGKEMHRSDPPDIAPRFPNTSIMVEKSEVDADLNSSKVDDHSGIKPKSLKKKMVARKTLGSKPTICKGKTTKQKGILSALLQTEFIDRSNGAIAIEETRNVPPAGKSVNVPPSTNEAIFVGDETEAPELEGPGEFEMGSKSSAEVEELHLEKPTHTREQTDDKTTRRKKGAKSRVKKSTEAKMSVSDQKTEFPEPKTSDVAEKTMPAGKKRPLVKSKINKSNDPIEKAKEDMKKTISSNKETVVLVGKTTKRPSKKAKRSDDVEKENEPVTIEEQSVRCDNGASGNSTSQKLKKPLKNSSKSNKVNAEDLNNKNQPAWFILSGHKLQRKEFQQVIKKLRGRLCRDSHNWSYQATHFINPDPIRRTEKFFAAAASGSWVLKTDYLTASTEAGRFVSEEPYEWHKKGLTEDGAINLEAPRKWRLLKERTGHGAFYGMCIVIYGECIAPPLDTLKRVVKAGDGTILATSPPYTRFLDSRIDFAIVSPGMLRVDPWVQEFLRHEVPCILADYLVEYVCKPGYSLERHVQYNTHAWAKRSLESLINRVEECVEEPKTPENNDAACRVCGRLDRGDEMLICGDESGTHGCGVGTHMDCLDPPLETVPEEDWFCPDCQRRREVETGNPSSKKLASKSKK